MSDTIKTKIPAEMEPAAVGGMVTDAKYIIDRVKNKNQTEINTDVGTEITNIKGGSSKSIANLDSRLGTVEQLAEISIGGGDAQIATGSDFTNPDSTKRAKVPTVGAVLDGLNDGVYDVSKRNPTGGENGDGKFTLAYILANANTLIPTSWRHGGMTISFVDSTDNKYVQFMYIGTSTTVTNFTNTANWEKLNLEEEVSQLGQKADGIFNSVLGEFSQEGLSTYQDFYVGTIPKGTIIVNNSPIGIIVAEDNNLTNRQDIGEYSRVIANSNKSLFRTKNIGGNVSLSFILPTNILIDGLGCIAEGAITNAAKQIGYNVEMDNVPAYFSIPSDIFISPIPIGTIIKNNGVKVGLFGQGSARKNLPNGQSWVTTFEVTDIKSLDVSGNIRLEIDTRNKLLDEVDIDGNNIQLNSIDINRLSFAKTEINIYDKDSDSEFVEGKYLISSGELNDNSYYNTSGFIKVEPNADYSYILFSTWRFALEYDENKNPITSTFADSINTIHTSANTHFLRLTFYANNAKYFLCNGNEPKPYEDYKLVIPSEYIENDENALPFFLPKHIYVANGRTIEIYYNQILLNADRYNIQATCPIGKALERKFQIIGDTSHIGNTYTLSLVAYNDAGDVVASGTSTIHIVLNTISSSKKILPVGDSLTNGKPWLAELSTLSDDGIVTVGTRRNTTPYHEGRSGASVSTYTNVTGGIVYNFDSSYRGAGYNTAPTFDDTTPYAAGTIVKKAHTFGSGQSGYRYCVFKVDHAAGAWVESEIYDLSRGNPFYDYVNEKFSMSFYKSFHSINYDAIILYLGTNGINLTPETNVDGALGIKNLIELIREDEPTIPIVVINTIFRSSQNGIGNQGNTDGYVAQSAYKFNEDKKVLLLAKAVDDLCGNMANVYLCPVGFTHDSKYNFGNNKVQVNPRLSSTDDVFELMPSDSVHPQTPGYMQMADEIFSTLCAIFNS